MRLWHCCRLILLPPARLPPPLGAAVSTLPFLLPPTPLPRPPPLSVSRHLRRIAPPAFNPSAAPIALWARLLSSLFHSVFQCLCLLFRSCSMSSPLISPLFFPVPFFTEPTHQYCIELFPSLLSDLAVIEPERSRQMDFCEKDTVMFGSLLLPSAN